MASPAMYCENGVMAGARQTRAVTAASAAAAADQGRQLLFSGDLAFMLVAAMTPRAHAKFACLSTTCAAVVRKYRNDMARFIVKRFRRFKLSPYAYQAVTLLGQPFLAKLRKFTPDPEAENPWYFAERLTEGHGDTRLCSVGAPSSGCEIAGRLDWAFDALPSPPKPICFVYMRDPDFDGHSRRVIPALNRGDPCYEDDDSGPHKDGDALPSFLNGFSHVCCESNCGAWGLMESEDGSEVVDAMNTALGTQFESLLDLWMDADERPCTPELFGSMAHPLWCQDLITKPELRMNKDVWGVRDGRATLLKEWATAFFAPGLKPGAHPSLCTRQTAALAQADWRWADRG